MKFKRSLQLGTTIYREKEFEEFCQKRLRNKDFRLGRTRETILGVEVGEGEGGNPTDGVIDISDEIKKRDDRELLDGEMSKAEIEGRAANEIPLESQMWVDKY